MNSLRSASRAAAPGPRRSAGRVAAAALSGVAGGLAVAAGDPAALTWGIGLAAGVLGLTVLSAREEHRHALFTLIWLAVAMRMALALAVQAFAPGFGGGFVTGDDATYYRLASDAARCLWETVGGVPAGAPPCTADTSPYGAFAALETAIFVVFGPNVRLAVLLNSALGALSAILIYTMTTRLFRARSELTAAGLVAFYPSLTLWSSLNLKDALTTAVAVLAVWSLVVLRFERSAISVSLPFAAAGALLTLRGYVAASVAVAALVSIALVPRPHLHRIGSTAMAALFAGLIVSQSLASVGVGDDEELLITLERQRAAMTVGARTGFGPTPGPSTTVDPAPDGAPAQRTIAYLPFGLAHVMFAPVPFLTTRTQEILTAPEMMLWYVLCAGAAATLWRERRNWRALAPPVLTVAGLISVLALAEGNVGTLFRHRGMVVPFVALLASPALRLVFLRVNPLGRAART